MSSLKNKLKKFFIKDFFLAIFFLLPFITRADSNNGIVVCKDPPDCEVGELIDTISKLATTFVEIGAAVVAIVIAWAGIQYLTAGGDQGKISGAREILTKAAVGFFIMLAAYVLVELLLSTLGAKDFVTQLMDNF